MIYVSSTACVHVGVTVSRVFVLLLSHEIVFNVHHELSEDIAKMSIELLEFWQPKFVLEVRRADQQHYTFSRLIVYSFCTGLQRSLKFNDQAEVRLFTDCNFLFSKYIRF